MGKTIYRGIRLDFQTDQVLRVLAKQQSQGNASFLVRALIRNEAERRGLWPVLPAQLSPRADAPEVQHVQTA